jgi:hypothetical protein
MIKESITVDEAIALLNSMVKADPEATEKLVEQRVPCNIFMADHPTVQVQVIDSSGGEVGLLGVINGLFGVDDKGWGPVAAQFEGDSPETLGPLIGFGRSENFKKVP